MSIKPKLYVATFILLFQSFFLLGQSVTYPTDRVAADFKKLLDRPKVDLNPSFESNKTDSVLIEHGFIYSEKNEKVPVLIYKPVT